MKNQNEVFEGFQELEESQLLEVFQVEELEKRYEFAWIDSIYIGVSPSGYTK
ncbi:hypothetical protein [Flavobacterium sp. 5]|uniref:hypothetical protein n=1 Tax=Flavobacterium sp. 5 TaxID=2035199 RepID=UPI000CBF8ABE|nr:hypothetical protein [Flavobacterium sp. 5]PKB16141.1 hypothetical protein CLU82_1263 [Flavobacterium sp. 5]